jgi:hypothetical protein
MAGHSDIEALFAKSDFILQPSQRFGERLRGKRCAKENAIGGRFGANANSSKALMLLTGSGGAILE